MTPLMRLLPVVLIAALIAFELRIPAMARAQVSQIELSREMVERFLASYPEVRALGLRYEDRAAEPRDRDPVAAFSSLMRHKTALDEIAATLDRHGFSSFAEWLDVARSVAIAYGFVKSGKSPGELDGQGEKALEDIRNTPRLDDARKREMEEMVKRQMDMLKHFAPRPGNLAVVRDMQPRIAAVLDSD